MAPTNEARDAIEDDENNPSRRQITGSGPDQASVLKALSILPSISTENLRLATPRVVDGDGNDGCDRNHGERTATASPLSMAGLA
jgi:hypothetical protein